MTQATRGWSARYSATTRATSSTTAGAAEDSLEDPRPQALTTAIGFLTLTFSSIPDLRELGQFAALGGHCFHRDAQPGLFGADARQGGVLAQLPEAQARAQAVQPHRVGHLGHVDRLVQQVLQVEIEDFQVELPGLDFGKVEDVVDQAQERFAAGAHGLGEPPLAWLVISSTATMMVHIPGLMVRSQDSRTKCPGLS